VGLARHYPALNDWCPLCNEKSLRARDAPLSRAVLVQPRTMMVYGSAYSVLFGADKDIIRFGTVFACYVMGVEAFSTSA
jgi:hypothetical protein